MNAWLPKPSMARVLTLALACTLAMPACATSATPRPASSPAGVPALAAAPNTAGPTSTVKLVFVHHSTGQAWLEDGYGGLAESLGENNYFVSDTNYGWGPDGIGDHTDIGDWWTWFRGTKAATYTTALYANTGINSGYDRTLTSPGGENTVIMFKSCFPNSSVGGSADDAVPAIADNPLAGNGMNDLTVGNAKGVYLDLLDYFQAHPEKLFVLVVSPPLRSSDTNASQSANARALANWLVSPTGLLSGYAGNNVFVFDYYTVLTGGHHRIVGSEVEHSAGPSNYLAYPTGDSHPSAAGDKIATAEFVPMLNAAYHAWQAGESATLPPTIQPRAGTLSRPAAWKYTFSHKKHYSWHGTVSPAQIGSSVVTLEIQRRSGGAWHAYAKPTTELSDTATTWSKRLRVKKTGRYRLRSRHADGDHFSAKSSWREFRVS